MYGLSLAQLVFSRKHDKYPYLWFPTKESVSGVIVNQREKTSAGLTFFCDCTCSAYLVDMDGEVVHKWEKDFYDVWPKPEHVRPYLLPSCNDMTHWCRAHLFADGSIVAIYEGAFYPYGGGIIKLDASSNIIWKVAINAHHDLHVGQDGKIYVLTRRHNIEDPDKPRIDEYLTVLSSDGKILKEISLLDTIKKSPYKGLIPNELYADYLHTNSVELLTEENAGGFPFLCCGDIMLSHLNINAITVLDKQTFAVKWVLMGISKNIHDADFLSNGRVVWFNNRAAYEDGIVGSRIIEWDCINHKPTWQFTPADFIAGIKLLPGQTDMFYSAFYGSQQQLGNGNYLITESNGGTIYEVTRAKEVVWKYVNPSFDGESIGGVYGAKRYAREDLPFLNDAQSQ